MYHNVHTTLLTIAHHTYVHVLPASAVVEVVPSSKQQLVVADSTLD